MLIYHRYYYFIIIFCFPSSTLLRTITLQYRLKFMLFIEKLLTEVWGLETRYSIFNLNMTVALICHPQNV